MYQKFFIKIFQHCATVSRTVSVNSIFTTQQHIPDQQTVSFGSNGIPLHMILSRNTPKYIGILCVPVDFLQQ